MSALAPWGTFRKNKTKADRKTVTQIAPWRLQPIPVKRF